MEEKIALPIKNAAVDQIKNFYSDFASLRLDRNRSRVVRMAGLRLMRTIRRLQLRVRGFLNVQAARRAAFNLLWRRVEIRERFAILRCEKRLLAKHKRTHEKDETAKTDWCARPQAFTPTALPPSHLHTIARSHARTLAHSKFSYRKKKFKLYFAHSLLHASTHQPRLAGSWSIDESSTFVGRRRRRSSKAARAGEKRRGKLLREGGKSTSAFCQSAPRSR